MLILSTLRHAGQHITAPAVLDEVRRFYPYVDASTVYRTLGSAAELGLPQAMARFERPGEAEVGPDRSNLADPTICHEFGHSADRGVGPHPHGFHQEHAAMLCLPDDSFCFTGVDRERLLAQHGLAGGDTQTRCCLMRDVRRGDVHDVDLRVGRELGPTAVRASDAGP